MHSVRRIPASKRLRGYLESWRTELSRKLRSHGPEDKSRAARKYWSGRVKTLLKKELRKTYGGCCCYCEDRVHSKAGQIDHRLPLAHFTEKTFDYKNLHYSCGVCNCAYKGDQFNLENPVLDACKDKVENHLRFDHISHIMIALSQRGKVTIDLCELNNQDLLEARELKYEDVIHLIKDFRDNFKDPLKQEYKKRKLLKMASHGSEFCSVARTLIRRNLDIFPEVNQENWEW